MRKYLRYANLLLWAAGILGMLLMCWLFAGGTDARGLYPAGHPGWISVGILTVLVVAATWLLTRQAGINRNYRANFPAALPSALGYGFGTVALLISSVAHIRGMQSSLFVITGFAGILSGAGLLAGVVSRLRGQRSRFPIHMLPCFFFALNLFILGQQFGSEPELCRYLYRFWATVALVPACYHLWGFDVKMGNRPNCLFWCLIAGYCNLVAAVGSEQWFSHICLAVWMLTALPKPGYLPKQPRPAPAAQPASPEETAPLTDVDIPTAEQAEVAQAPLTPERNPLAVELADPDAILEQLLQEFSQQENP